MCFINVIFTCVNVCKCSMWDASLNQIKVITMKRSKLTIKFDKIVVDLQEFVVIKVLFKTISGKFISKLCSQLNMINSCKLFYIRYKMRGKKHPWVHKQEFKVLESSRCTTCIQSFVNPSRIFFWGCTPTPWRFFLNNSGTPW